MALNQKRTCQDAGYQLAYQREGEGDPVLLVHGITTYAFIWRELIPRHSAQYDVIAVDLLGCGESDKLLNESYSIKRHAELLHAFMDQLGVECFHTASYFIQEDEPEQLVEIMTDFFEERVYVGG